jgi:hypothetical protein
MGKISERHKLAIRAAVHNNVASYQQEQADFIGKIKFEETAVSMDTSPTKKLNFMKNIFSKFQK